MSGVAFLAACAFAATGVMAAVARPQLLVIHAALIGLWATVYVRVVTWIVCGALAFVLALLLARVADLAVRLANRVWVRRADLPFRPRGERLQQEVRRFAVDVDTFAFGTEFEAWATRKGMTRVRSCDDPGNPGRILATYTLPASWQDTDQWLLVMVDASPDPQRGGLYSLYGEIVTTPDPLAGQAAGWRDAPSDYAATSYAT
ncbi:hypothetical protein ACIB24_12565 [Spongisporangium articulatum]|uniref:Uncharacterized protein n=1 Tax=Spongisporangium articulatum TaxID=3362603 RepID=A0ABW8AQH7_9ACTN